MGALPAKSRMITSDIQSVASAATKEDMTGTSCSGIRNSARKLSKPPGACDARKASEKMTLVMPTTPTA